MESSEAKNPAKIILFAGVGLVLLGLIIGGVVWAKNRADMIANKPSEPAKEQPAVPDPTPPQPETPTAQPNSAVAGTQTTPPVVVAPGITVPAAGAEDTFFLAGMVSVATFLGVRFVRSRRQNAS